MLPRGPAFRMESRIRQIWVPPATQSWAVWVPKVQYLPGSGQGTRRITRGYQNQRGTQRRIRTTQFVSDALIDDTSHDNNAPDAVELQDQFSGTEPCPDLSQPGPCNGVPNPFKIIIFGQEVAPDPAALQFLRDGDTSEGVPSTSGLSDVANKRIGRFCGHLKYPLTGCQGVLSTLQYGSPRPSGERGAATCRAGLKDVP